MMCGTFPLNELEAHGFTCRSVREPNLRRYVGLELMWRETHSLVLPSLLLQLGIIWFYHCVSEQGS